jgi:glyoxylase-like metal-dependent hydrolase (beta-lactamase superfamily II)
MSLPLPSFVDDLGSGLFCIDTGFHRDRFDAAYLMVNGGRAAFIDTGTHFAVPRLLATLEALGIARSAVDWVIPTHVHLDHAGGVGLLMQSLPAARVLVHPRGVRHMVDPTMLWQGALAVYGEAEMARSYGTLHGVPAERVNASADGMTVSLAGRELMIADTPGHARHHHCVWDAATRGWFTGDTFGLSYRELDSPRGPWIMPTSTPVQFEPELLKQSVQRLLSQDPECMYLTHFGCVGDVQRLGGLLLTLLQDMVELGQALREAPERHAALQRGMLALFADSLASHGLSIEKAELAELLAIDLELNAQGLAIWLDRRAG